MRPPSLRNHFITSRARLEILSIAAGTFLSLAAVVFAEPAITEFMADNVVTLQDEDGDYPDWIEVTNRGPGSLDLGGWHLTDDPRDPTKWEVPAPILLNENQTIVIFASGKNRRTSGRPLHTNFALDRSGEFLALVAPDGTTMASQFAPYPPQEADFSYGFGFGPSRVTEVLVDDDSQGLLSIPSGPVPDAWRGGAPFDDAAWTPVQLGIGFHTEGGPVIGGAGGAGSEVVAYSAAAGTAGTQPFGGALGMDFAVLEPITVTELGVFDDLSDGLNRTLAAELWSRVDGGGGSILASETFTPTAPGSLEAGHRFKALGTPLALAPGAYTIVAHGYGSDERAGNSGGNGDFTTSNDGGDLIQFVGSSRFGSTPGAWPDSEDGGGPARYGAGTFKFRSSASAHLRTDLENTMHGQNASALLRIPFHYAGPEAASGLDLEIAYDDGFVAWLNGEVLTSRNAPADPFWNTSATGEGNEVVSIPVPASSLLIGENVLAIQGMNESADDSDFIIAPRLVANFSRLERLYFALPTPGGPNQPGTPGTGIVINEIHYDPESNTAPAEFVELYNAGAETVDLSGWALTDAVEYTFPPNTVLEPNEYLVVTLSASFFQSDFGDLPVLTPFTGRLGNDGDDVELRDQLGELIDRVNYDIGAPWPVAGDEPYPSIQLVHPGQDNDLAGSWRAASPTPGARNAVFAVDTPPQIRQVEHAPQAPRSGEAVTITCKVSDPDGLASVALEYQVVRPGGYVRLDDPSFISNWTAVEMTPVADNEDHFETTLPGTLQDHRRLVRYRIVAEDTLGQSVTVPLPSDPSANFAYFVYDGAPAWEGALIPGETPTLEFSAETMNSLPIYHLIAQEADVLASQYNTSFNDKVYRFEGALVYDGVVYDHIHFRIRGHGSTYNTGKNKWKLRFNRGHYFQGHDDYGRAYREKVRTLNWSALASPWNPANRGAAGLDEALAFRMWRMAGIPAHNTNYFHLRIIDSAREASSTIQFAGDNWGLYLAIEQADRRFLDERGLPDGNTFNMHFGSSNILNQGYGQPSDRSDLFTFTGTGTGGYNRVRPVQPVSWWERRVDLESYYSYRAIVEAINHSDLRDQENSILYHNPETRLWTMIPWDVDLLYEEFDRWGPNAVQSPAPLEQFRKALTHPEINMRFQNRARELQDLLLNEDQGWTLVDEISTILGSIDGNLGMAELDAARWNQDPRTRRVEGSSPNPRMFFFMNPYTSTRFAPRGRTLSSPDFAGMRDWVKQFIIPRGFGGRRFNAMIRDSAIPATPEISYAGTAGFPTDGLTFSTSDFEPGNRGAEFAAIEWRVGEISNPEVETFVPGEPWKYEIDSFWSSGPLDSFTEQFTIPPVAVEVGRTYRARVRHQGVDGRWSHWSEPVEFVTVDPNLQPYLEGLVVSEIMYNPAGDNQDLEYLELTNIGATALDMTPVRFSEGIAFDFAESAVTTLLPGATVLVVRNSEAFEAEYGVGPPVAGEYQASDSDNLSNTGERLVLSFGANSTMRDFTYDDDLPWPEAADGNGYSLTLIAPTSNPDHALAANWRSSALAGGSPGESDVRTFTGDPAEDLDGDGLGAFLEHALGGDPATADYGLLPSAGVVRIEVEGTFDSYLTITSRRNLAADDVILSAELSSNLVDWESGPAFAVLASETPHGDGTSTIVWRSVQPLSAADARFIRVAARERP